MVEQYKKASAERDMPLIHQHMMHTFPLQLEEIITTSSPVSELKDRWPALFYETQLTGLYKKKKTGLVGQTQHPCNKNSSPDWPIHLPQEGFFRHVQNMQDISG